MGVSTIVLSSREWLHPLLIQCNCSDLVNISIFLYLQQSHPKTYYLFQPSMAQSKSAEQIKSSSLPVFLTEGTNWSRVWGEKRKRSILQQCNLPQFHVEEMVCQGPRRQGKRSHITRKRERWFRFKLNISCHRRRLWFSLVLYILIVVKAQSLHVSSVPLENNWSHSLLHEGKKKSWQHKVHPTNVIRYALGMYFRHMHYGLYFSGEKCIFH